MPDRMILWAIVIAYMLFVFFKGVAKARKIGDTDDFLVAGRNVRWFLLFCTMGATVIGGGYSIGAIGRTYEWGILMLLVSTGGYLHFIFSGLVVAPQFREARLYTVAGYFGYRFGEGPRFLVLILSLLFSVFIVAAQMAAFGTVLSAILPGVADAANLLRWAILIGGCMVVIYSTAGGLMAVIHTDLFQFIVLFLGFLITLGFCIPDIVGSYDRELGRFMPSGYTASDFVDPGSAARRLESGTAPIDVYMRDRLRESGRSLPELEDGAHQLHRHDEEEHHFPGQDEDSGHPHDSLPEALAASFNAVLDDLNLYDPDRFENVVLSRQSMELLERAPTKGRDLRRLNLSILQDAYADEITRERRISPDFFKVEGGKGWLFLITTFFAFLLGETFAPGYATRYCVGRNIRETKIGIAGVGFFLALTFPLILFFIALYARIHFPDIDPQQALPMVVQQLHNPVIGGLMIGALLMAVMSSADSALNSATAIFVKDLFEHQLGWKDKGDGRTLRLARICTAALGVAAILVAVLWSDIIGLLLFTYHVWAPAIILPVVVGTLSKYRSPNLTWDIAATMIIATALTMLYRSIRFLDDRVDWIDVGEGMRAIMEGFDPAVFGVGISILAYVILRLRRSLLSSGG